QSADRRETAMVRAAVVAVALLPAAVALARSHPFELSYYNLAVGGLPGAMRRGLEVTYWYDAVTPETIERMNRWLPRGARLTLPAHTDVFAEWQALGRLRGDLELQPSAGGPLFALLLTQSAKSNPTTRLLFAQPPAFPPVEHQGVRLFGIYDAAAVGRAQALALLSGAVRERARPGAARMIPPSVSKVVLETARKNPEAVLEAAAELASGRALHGPPGEDADVRRILADVLPRAPQRREAPGEVIAAINATGANCLADAARLLVARPEAIARIIRYEGYLPAESFGGLLEPHLAHAESPNGPLEQMARTAAELP
ncbi:MAG: hypothetical protein ACOC46_04330, partial [Pirellulales bacterium]